MISAALNGGLNEVEYEEHPVFGLSMPVSCPGVPSDILNPKNTWDDKQAYDLQAAGLALDFVSNFKQYSEYADNEILKSEPRIVQPI